MSVRRLILRCFSGVVLLFVLMYMYLCVSFFHSQGNRDWIYMNDDRDHGLRDQARFSKVNEHQQHLINITSKTAYVNERVHPPINKNKKSKRIEKHEAPRSNNDKLPPKNATSSLKISKVRVYASTGLRTEDLNKKILEYVQIKKNERVDPFVNLHIYKFYLNSQVCKFGKFFLVMLIHSAPNYFRKRTLIRTSFGSVGEYRQRHITKVFMIGAVENDTLQQMLNEESRTFGDIVQGNFQDKYSTLVRKHIMAMHWYKHNCNSEYILKMDDDTFMNPYRMIEYLVQAKPAGLQMQCKIAKGYFPNRDTKSKYYTPKSQYPFSVFPNFCLGFAYLTTPEALDEMYKASETTTFMNMDDVYVGMLSMKAKVKQVDFSGTFLPCVGRNHLNLKQLNKKPIVFDPFSWCGDIPFKNWKVVAP